MTDRLTRFIVLIVLALAVQGAPVWTQAIDDSQKENENLRTRGEAIQPIRGTVISGLRAGEVSKRFGLPAEVSIGPDDSIVDWRYEKPLEATASQTWVGATLEEGAHSINGLLRFKSGRLVFPDSENAWPGLSGSYLDQSSSGKSLADWIQPSPDLPPSGTANDLNGLGRAALLQGRYADAVALFQRCLALPDSRTCQAPYETTLTEYVPRLLSAEETLSRNDLYARRALLQKAYSLNPSLAEVASEIGKLSNKITEARVTAADFVKESDQRITLPQSLVPLVDFLPELATVQKAVLLRNAASLLSAGAYGPAFDVLTPHAGSSDVDEILETLGHTYLEALNAKAQLPPPSTWFAFEGVLTDLERAKDYLRITDLRPIRTTAVTAVRHVLAERVQSSPSIPYVEGVFADLEKVDLSASEFESIRIPVVAAYRSLLAKKVQSSPSIADMDDALADLDRAKRYLSTADLRQIRATATVAYRSLLAAEVQLSENPSITDVEGVLASLDKSSLSPAEKRSTKTPAIAAYRSLLAAKVQFAEAPSIVDVEGVLADLDRAKRYLSTADLRQIRADATTAYQNLLTAEVQFSPSSPLREVERVLAYLDNKAKQYLSTEDLRPIRTSATVAARKTVDQHLGALTLSSPAGYRMAQKFLLVDTPVLRAKVRDDLTSYPVAFASDAVPRECNSVSLRTNVASALPSWIQVSSNRNTDISIRVDGIQCDTTYVESTPEAVGSTYVARYNQVPNPAYYRAQARVQRYQADAIIARATAAVRNNFVNRAQVIIADQLVQNAMGRLSRTPPFLSEPVNGSYTASRVRRTYEVRIRASVTVTDRTTGMTDGLYLSASDKKQAQGMRNVHPEDTKGLRNSEPELTGASTLLRNAKTRLAAEAETAVRVLGERLFLARAEQASRQGASNAAPLVVANLMLAREFGAKPTELGRFQGFLSEFERRAATARRTGQRERLPTIQVPAGLFPSLAAQAPATVPPSAAVPSSPSSMNRENSSSSRVKMLENVLQGVVTVKTDVKRSGSGFFVSANGLVVTNAHVIEGASRITVVTADQRTLLASRVALSIEEDLALLRVPGMVSTALTLGDSNAARVGINVFAVGSPHGYEGTVTRGMISQVRRVSGSTFVQTDAAINSGNSGGPLITEDGQVIAVNTYVLDGADSIAFSIAINDVKRLFRAYLYR